MKLCGKIWPYYIATGGNIIRRIRFAFWINKATDTQSEYVLFIVFFNGKFLRDCASVLRYCLSC